MVLVTLVRAAIWICAAASVDVAPVRQEQAPPGAVVCDTWRGKANRLTVLKEQCEATQYLKDEKEDETWEAKSGSSTSAAIGISVAAVGFLAALGYMYAQSVCSRNTPHEKRQQQQQQQHQQQQQQ